MLDSECLLALCENLMANQEDVEFAMRVNMYRQHVRAVLSRSKMATCRIRQQILPSPICLISEQRTPLAEAFLGEQYGWNYYLTFSSKT